MTVDELIHALVAARLLSESDVPALRQAGDAAEDSTAVANRLVRAGKLTKFQAVQALAGKTKALLLDEYLILDRVGSGGMGQVYKAQHTRMKRIVALKVLSPAALKDAQGAERFQREVQAAAKLMHPNIVTAFDAGDAHGQHYLVMEYVEGEDLARLVKRSGPLSVDHAVDYIRQAATGLAFAHAEGVVHRDIKPANLLLDKKGVVKVLDMGLARCRDPLLAPHTLTKAGQVFGTVDYMAPEQAESPHDADARSDIYSLGCSLYRLLTAENIYAGESMVKIIMAHREQPAPDLLARRPDVPPLLDAVYRRMVAKLPGDRYQTMTEVVAALDVLRTDRASQTVTSAGPTADDRGSQTTTDQPKRAAEMPKTLTFLAKTMTSEKSRNLAIKIVGGTFATIIAPVLVALGLKWMDGPAPAPNANSASPQPAPTAGQPSLEAADTTPKPKPNDPSATPDPARVFGAFKPLFNGRDLSGWTAEDGRWRVDAANQTLVGENATGDRKNLHSWIFTERTFTDFALRFEYRIGPETDSGILLRMPVGGELDKHYEIHLANNEGQQIANGTILGLRKGPGHPHTKPITSVEQRPDWNQVEIELRGRRLRMTINGQLVQDVRFGENPDLQSNKKILSDTGRIGLQSRLGHIEFRQIEIQE